MRLDISTSSSIFLDVVEENGIESTDQFDMMSKRELWMVVRGEIFVRSHCSYSLYQVYDHVMA